jgi:putative restriction endonuclease
MHGISSRTSGLSFTGYAGSRCRLTSKTAHWLFDRGFWSINDDYTVLVKSGAFEEAGDAGQLLKPHAGRQILLPTSRGAWPNPSFLAWHRANHGFEGRH